MLPLFKLQQNDDTSKIKTYVGDDGLIHFTNKDGADSVLNFSKSGLNATIVVRCTNSIYSSAGHKQEDTLIDVEFTIENGKVKSQKTITNAGANVGGYSFRPDYMSIISIKTEK